jgi:MFS family permease
VPSWPAYAGALAEGACLAVVLFLLPLYAAKQFGPQRAIAAQAIVAAPALVVLFASNMWGAAADVLGRSLPLIALGLGAYAATFLALLGAHSLRDALLIVLLGSTVYSAAAPLVRSYVTLTATTQKGRSLGGLLFFETLGLALANGLANTHYDAARPRSGMQAILLATAAVALAGMAAVAVAARGETRRVTDARRTSLAGALFGDLRELYTSPSLRAIVGVALPTFAAQFLYIGMVNLLLRDRWQMAPAAVGRVLLAHALLGLAVFPFAGRLADTMGGWRVLAFGAIGQATKFGALFFVPSARWAGICAALPLFPLVTTGSAAAIAAVSRDSRRAGGMGILMGTLAAGAAIGPLLGGVVADTAGVAATPLCASALAALTVLLAIVKGFFHRRGGPRSVYTG